MQTDQSLFFFHSFLTRLRNLFRPKMLRKPAQKSTKVLFTFELKLTLALKNVIYALKTTYRVPKQGLSL